jgi:hypothetical protein
MDNRLLGVVTGIAAFAVTYAFLRSRREVEGYERAAADGPDRFDSDEEPVLGYDGMDLQTVLPWLENANLDRATLHRVRAYERSSQQRQAVLDLIDDLLS